MKYKFDYNRMLLNFFVVLHQELIVTTERLKDMKH